MVGVKANPRPLPETKHINILENEYSQDIFIQCRFRQFCRTILNQTMSLINLNYIDQSI